MSHLLSAPFWWELFGAIALQIAAVVLLAFALQHTVRPPLLHRTIWRLALMTIAVLVMCECAGLGQIAVSWARQQLETHKETPSPVPQGRGDVQFEVSTGGAMPELITLPAPEIPPPKPALAPMRWPGLLWLGGFTLMLARLLLGHAWLGYFWRRQHIDDERLCGQVQALAQRVGIRRRLHLVESAQLRGPVTFGLVRPGIGLPPDFTSRFSSAQQEAMLAHELAHVRARDPLWAAFAEMMCALLWWHPLVWWAKRRLSLAAEITADEASLLIKNGPQELAESLVVLGGRLTRSQPLGWLSVEGSELRSGLGRRVQRLLGWHGRSWRPPRRAALWLTRTLAPVTMLLIAILCSAWLQARKAQAGTLTEAFQQSFLGLALTAALPADRGSAASEPKADPPAPIDRIDWTLWSPAAVEEARKEGRIVLVHFTADWSVTAKANEQTSIEIDAVRLRLRELGAVTLRADHTQPDELIAAELRKHERTSVPLLVVYPKNSDTAPIVLPEVLTPELVLKALNEASLTTAAPPRKTDPDAERKNAVPSLLLQAKSLLDTGKFQEAEAKLNEALKLDPSNSAAKHYLAQLQLQRDASLGTRPAEPSKETLHPFLGDLPFVGRLFRTNAPPVPNRTNFVHTSKGRLRIQQKLDTVRLTNVTFDGLPLGTVVQQLATQAKARDPHREGVNFIVTESATNAMVRIQAPLNDLTFRETLDVIVHVAKPPVIYMIEDYAVVFMSANDRPPPPLYTRWFKLDPNTFLAGVRSMLGTNAIAAELDNTSGRPVELPPVKRANELDVLPPRQNSGVTHFEPITRGDEVYAATRTLFSRAGVDFTQPGKHLIYNDRLGMLMARATLQDLDLIEQTIQVLNTPPPQVTIEVKFCEATEADSKALGFDWLLGAAAPATMLDNGPATITGILTEAQFRVVLRALEQRKGVNILSAPKVTTLSGRQAQIKTVEVRYIVTDMDYTTNSQSGQLELKAVTEKFELGPIIDVIPYVAADGHTIAMTVIPTLRQFVGYDLESDKSIRKRINSGAVEREFGLPLEQPIPLPVFRLRQMVSSATVWDGQTLVLMGGTMDHQNTAEAASGNQSSRKGATGLLNGQKSAGQKKSLLVFVTPTLIDPAGNRIHSDDDLPFRRNGIPPQKPPAPK